MFPSARRLCLDPYPNLNPRLLGSIWSTCNSITVAVQHSHITWLHARNVHSALQQNRSDKVYKLISNGDETFALLSVIGQYVFKRTNDSLASWLCITVVTSVIVNDMPYRQQTVMLVWTHMHDHLSCHSAPLRVFTI